MFAYKKAETTHGYVIMFVGIRAVSKGEEGEARFSERLMFLILSSLTLLDVGTRKLVFLQLPLSEI